MRKDQYSVQEVAQGLGVSPEAVYRLIGRGTLSTRFIGRVRYIERRVIVDLIQSPGFQKRRRGAKSIEEVYASFGITWVYQGELYA